MGWMENRLVCCFFVSVYLLAQAECGPVAGDPAKMDEIDPPFATSSLIITRRAIKDCSGLQKDLDEMKIKCRSSYKVAKHNIDGLKSQLNYLLKQAKATKSPTKDVLNILQKFVELQETEALTETEKNATEIKRLEKRRKEAERDLAQMKQQFSGIATMIKHPVSKRSAETPQSAKATSTALNEFKKFLEDRLKQPGEQGATANQVLQIIILQIEAMELKTRVSDKIKVQAQIDVITSRLENKNGLLSDLKEERQDRPEYRQKIDKLIAGVEKELLNLNTDLSALKQTLAQLNEQTKEFDRKRADIMDKIAKLKGKDELLSRILVIQFEFMEALSTAQGQIKADEFRILDLQKELVKEQERALYLDAENQDLREKLFAQKEQCKDLMDLYLEAEAQLDAKVEGIADSTSKTAVQIILLGIEIDRITKQIKESSSNDDLKRLRDEKLKELKAKKEELQKSDASAEKILKVISQMEEIWKLQNDDPENLKQISDLQKNLLNLIQQLDDKMPAKPMLNIMALQSDVAWVREMLKKVTTQAETQKNELLRELAKKERLLNDKNAELATATGNINQLKKDIDLLKKEISTLKTQQSTAEENAKKKIKELEEKLKQSDKALDEANTLLKEKDAALARQVTEINNLIEEVRTLKEQLQEKELQLKARIAELERKLTKKEEENEKLTAEYKKLKDKCADTTHCPEIEEKFKEMQAEYNATISKLKSENLQKFFVIKALTEEIAYLDKQIAQGFPGLKEELEWKTKELEEAKQELKAQGSISAKTLEVLELLTEIWKLQENPTEKNLEKIQQLEVKLNGLLNELQNSGEKGLGLSLKVVSIKESMSRLKQAQAQMEEQYKKEINGLKKQIEDKEKEILVLKAKCDQSGQLNDRIKQLEKEAEENKQKMEKLQEESDNKIASLEKQIETKNQQLANSEEKLKEANADNAALIKKLNNLNEEMQKITEQHNNALQQAEKEIAGLKDKLQKAEDTIDRKDKYLQEKDNTIGLLKDQLDIKKNELDKVKENNQKLEAELKAKDQQLANAEARLKDTEAKNQDLIRAQNKLENELKKVTEEKNTLQDKISDLKNTVEDQKQELAKKDKKLQEKDKEVETLKKENDQVKTELNQEKAKNNGLVNENAGLKDKLNQTEEKLKELEEKNELPEKEWPSFDKNTAHRRLLLSLDEKEARTSLLGQAVSDTPERYDTAIAALGKQGYDSGKHYWEISVIGRNCYIVGVVKASADRKGVLSYGPSAGYWVVMRKRDGTLVAFDNQVKLFSVSPSVIGVKLDLKNNEVTFYNVEQKTKIYTFSGKELKGRVYPYIETCSDSNINDPPVILKQPQSIDWLK